MPDITKENYAEWLEDALKHLFEYKPTSIAIAAVNDDDGTSATTYYNCDAGMLAYIAGVIQQDGLFMRIENNTDWLKELLEDEE